MGIEDLGLADRISGYRAQVRREQTIGGGLSPCPSCGVPRCQRSDYIRCSKCGVNWIEGADLTRMPNYGIGVSAAKGSD